MSDVHHAFCKNCRSPDIRMYINSPGCNRPLFKCYGCNQTFTYGRDGGSYMLYCWQRQDNKKEHEPDYVIDLGNDEDDS